MKYRRGLALAAFSVALPAQAGELSAVAARQFVAGKVFSYRCFDGTNGNGRINADGSVQGHVRVKGSGALHNVALPAGTVKVSSTAVCASVRGVPFSPCFNVNQTSPVSFRGSISGFGFAYCDFVRQGTGVQVAEAMKRSRTMRSPAPIAIGSVTATPLAAPAEAVPAAKPTNIEAELRGHAPEE